MTDSANRPIVIIPARMAATRLPGKPLAEIAGVPMIAQVLARAREADLGPVVVASGDAEVAAAARAAGARAVDTDPDLPSGSDRVHAALCAIDPDGRHDIVINLQGDLPTVDPATIRASLQALADPGTAIGTLVCEIDDDAELDDPNVVKVAYSPYREASGPDAPELGRALYFSRARIPDGAGPHYHHIGLYSYRRGALQRFVALPPSGLERRERLEQLRALEAGMRIDAARVDTIPLGVDTPADLEKARAILTWRGVRGPMAPAPPTSRKQ